jgi:hypothetical protein
MGDERGDLILEYMPRVDRRVQDVQDDLRAVRARMSGGEERLGRIDGRRDARADRIERRLDPVAG